MVAVLSGKFNHYHFSQESILGASFFVIIAIPLGKQHHKPSSNNLTENAKSCIFYLSRTLIGAAFACRISAAIGRYDRRRAIGPRNRSDWRALLCTLYTETPECTRKAPNGPSKNLLGTRQGS